MFILVGGLTVKNVTGLASLRDAVNLPGTLANRVPADDDPSGSAPEAGDLIRFDQPFKNKRLDHILTTATEHNRNQHDDSPLGKTFVRFLSDPIAVIIKAL